MKIKKQQTEPMPNGYSALKTAFAKLRGGDYIEATLMARQCLDIAFDGDFPDHGEGTVSGAVRASLEVAMVPMVALLRQVEKELAESRAENRALRENAVVFVDQKTALGDPACTHPFSPGSGGPPVMRARPGPDVLLDQKTGYNHEEPFTQRVQSTAQDDYMARIANVLDRRYGDRRLERNLICAIVDQWKQRPARSAVSPMWPKEFAAMNAMGKIAKLIDDERGLMLRDNRIASVVRDWQQRS